MNIKKMIKEVIREELEELLPKLINKALMREVTMEDGHSEPGVVKSVVKNINAIDQLVFYLPYIEKAILGVQADICETKNKMALIIKQTDYLLHYNGNNINNRLEAEADFKLLDKKSG